MRIGGPVDATNPDEWVKGLLERGYTAGVIPNTLDVNDTVTQDEFVKSSKQADIVIAEVGAWSNPLSTDETERTKALSYCQDKLAIADRLGAKCCVNIAGSRGNKWDGPSSDNLTEDTFSLIVDSVREIIDAVNPNHTFYTLEPMPWMYPNDIGSYLRMIKAVDRKQFAVHLDPTNMITSIEKYVNNGEFLKECFQQLGPYIKSVHAKDIILRDKLTLHLDETRPGNGTLDYNVFLNEMKKLPQDMPFLLEHLPNEDEYRKGANFVRTLAREKEITL